MILLIVLITLPLLCTLAGLIVLIGQQKRVRLTEQALEDASYRAAEFDRRLRWMQQQLEQITTNTHGRPAVGAADAKPVQPQPVEPAVSAAAEDGSEAAAPATPAEETPAPMPAPAPQDTSTLEALRRVRQARREHGAADPSPAAAAAASTAAPPTTPKHPGDPGPDPAPPTARPIGLEELLAGKVFVWIGAVALVLTAAFLLKLGFDSGIIDEPVRVIGAAVFGLGLWAAGEWMRRRSAMIAQSLCGAAVAVLFASVLAGHNLYGLIGGGFAFACMAVITASAVLLALRHGPAVALLGMVGGFMLPPVLAEGFGGPTGGMVLYLLALEAGVLAVAGRRGWFGLSTLALLFAMIWGLGYTLIGDDPGQRTLTAALVIGTAAGYVANTTRLYAAQNRGGHAAGRLLGLAVAAVGSSAAIVGLLAVSGGFTVRDLWTLGLVAAGVIALGRLDKRYAALPIAVMALSAAVLLAGAARRLAVDDVALDTLIGTAVGYGALFLIGGYASLWGGRPNRLPAIMTALAGPAFFAITVYAGHAEHGWRQAWWPYALGLAGVYAVGAAPMIRWRREQQSYAISALSLTAFGLACVALAQSLDHPRLAVCLSLAAAAAALVDRRLSIRPLLVAAVGVAGLAGFILVVPGPAAIDIRGGAVFNTLLPVYLLPTLALGVIAWCAARADERPIARGMTRLAAGFGALLLVVLVRDAFHPGRFFAPSIGVYEWPTYTIALMLGALGAWVVAARYKLADVKQAASVIAMFGAMIGSIGVVGPGNPLLHADTIGGWGHAMGLVYLYGVPAGLMWAWGRVHERSYRPELGNTLRTLSLILIAVFTAQQIRNAFHADDLHTLSIGVFECATYALAWMLLGGLFMLLSPQLRGQRLLMHAGRTVCGLGLGVAVVGNVLVLNPLWTDTSVGSLPGINGLWYLFGPAVVALALLAQRLRRRQRQAPAQAAGYTAIALVFLIASLLVRQGFSGDGVLVLDARPVISERYAYSLAWVLLGGGLLLAGLLSRLDTLRYGSLAVMLVAVAKVFLIDTASLDNLYRVFSFFGLGVTLIGLGYVYQRFVFHRDLTLWKGSRPA